MSRRVALISVIALGCGRQGDSVPDTVATQPYAVAPVSASVSDSPGARSGSPCPHTGLWAACTMERRLKQAGFVVKRLDEKPDERAGFSVNPIVYSLGSSRLEAFIYDDEKSLEGDIALLDTITVAPKGTSPTWESTPVLIRSANLAIVLLTQNQRQAERVMLAITAGAPQPGSPR
jgi:hypothetical protein